jgi:hypothetical protein
MPPDQGQVKVTLLLEQVWQTVDEIDGAAELDQRVSHVAAINKWEAAAHEGARDRDEPSDPQRVHRLLPYRPVLPIMLSFGVRLFASMLKVAKIERSTDHRRRRWS